MNEPMNSGEFQAHTEQIERLVQRVSGLADEDARASGLELLQSVMDFNGAVLSRVVEVLWVRAKQAGHRWRSLAVILWFADACAIRTSPGSARRPCEASH